MFVWKHLSVLDRYFLYIDATFDCVMYRFIENCKMHCLKTPH